MADNNSNKDLEQEDYITSLRVENERLQKKVKSLEDHIKSLKRKYWKIESDVEFQTEATLRCYDALRELSKMRYPTRSDIREMLADCEDLIQIEEYED